MREFFFESEGMRLGAKEAGEGPAIIMLHGGMADHRAALPLVAPLRERYRIIVPDLRWCCKGQGSAPLTFEGLAADVRALLTHVHVDTAVVGGMSSGAGAAIAFALANPSRVEGLVLVTPCYAGEEEGYTAQQEEIFSGMDAVASRAPAEGVGVLRPLYENLPAPIRQKALAMTETFDGPSVAATSRFIASGTQPFRTAADLATVDVPTLLVRGDDPVHPAEVSDLYARMLPRCHSVSVASQDIPTAIGNFCDGVVFSHRAPQ